MLLQLLEAEEDVLVIALRVAFLWEGDADSSPESLIARHDSQADLLLVTAVEDDDLGEDRTVVVSQIHPVDEGGLIRNDHVKGLMSHCQLVSLPLHEVELRVLTVVGLLDGVVTARSKDKLEYTVVIEPLHKSNDSGSHEEQRDPVTGPEAKSSEDKHWEANAD